MTEGGKKTLKKKQTLNLFMEKLMRATNDPPSLTRHYH